VIIKRSRGLPPELRPPLDPHERVAAWARVEPGSVVVATDRGLFLPGRSQRLGWHEIHKAAWDGRQLVITRAEVVEIRGRYAVMADAPPVSVTLPEPGDLPQVVRTRVTRSVSFSSHQRVPGGGVRVAARKVPRVDGLSWTVRYDHGTDPYGPGVPDATARLVDSIAEARHDASI
jgi:hypothetical protein